MLFSCLTLGYKISLLWHTIKDREKRIIVPVEVFVLLLSFGHVEQVSKAPDPEVALFGGGGHQVEGGVALAAPHDHREAGALVHLRPLPLPHFIEHVAPPALSHVHDLPKVNCRHNIFYYCTTAAINVSARKFTTLNYFGNRGDLHLATIWKDEARCFQINIGTNGDFAIFRAL